MEIVATNINMRMENPAQGSARVSHPSLPEAETVAQSPKQPDRQAGTQELEQAKRVLEGRFDVKVELAQDEETGRSVVRILSPDGERVLRQMPPDAAIELAEAAQRGYSAGIMASVA